MISKLDCSPEGVDGIASFTIFCSPHFTLVTKTVKMVGKPFCFYVFSGSLALILTHNTPCSFGWKTKPPHPPPLSAPPPTLPTLSALCALSVNIMTGGVRPKDSIGGVKLNCPLFLSLSPMSFCLVHADTHTRTWQMHGECAYSLAFSWTFCTHVCLELSLKLVWG